MSPSVGASPSTRLSGTDVEYDGPVLPRVLPLLALLACTATSCTPPPKPLSLTSRGRLVRIGKGDPPAGAKELGPVTVTEGVYCAGEEGTYANALVHLRNTAARKGANYVELMTMTEPHQDTRFCYDNRFIIRGLLFALPDAPATGSDAASDDDCSPPCSPGFTCDEGACEPECNPECPANQVCRVDRTCGPPATGEGAK